MAALANKIHISRVGEDAVHTFTLNEVIDGAVRESGLFPEIYKSAWPKVTSGAYTTGVERKLHEGNLTLASYDFPLFMPPSLLPKALEDSKEAEKKQTDIVRVKMDKGFLGPVRGSIQSLNERFGIAAAQGFMDDIALRGRVSSLDHMVAIGDDRALFSEDPTGRLKHLLYGGLAGHPNAQVREVLEEGHDVPGKRVKEVDGARLGILNSVYEWHEAVAKMRAEGINEGINTPALQRMDTTLCFVPVVPGSLPLPEEGLIIKAEGAPRTLRDVSEHDIERLQKGRILTYDHFDMPIWDGVPSWMSVRDYKRALVANDWDDKERKKYSSLDHDRIRRYLTHAHSPGAAMTAFAHIVGLPHKDDNKKSKSRRPKPKKTKTPKTVWSSAHLIHDRPSKKDVRESLALPKGMSMSKREGSLDRGLAELEAAVHSAQAFVVQDPDGFEIREPGLKEDEARLLRQLETSLIYAYLVTMSTQVSPSHMGRPHLVDKEWYKEWGRWHPDLCNLGMTGDDEKEAYRLFRSRDVDIDEHERYLAEGLREHFDETTYQHAVNQPPNGFKNQEQIMEMLGMPNLGFTVAMYGSSSGFPAETYEHPMEIAYQLSKLQGLSTVQGGGVRSGMLGMWDGALKAYAEGYDVRSVGIRSEKDVSPLEGSIFDWIREKGFEAVIDPENERHITFLNKHMHILQFDNILPRQAAIATIADMSVVTDGGKGSVLEMLIMATHNARINLLGPDHGLLPRSDIIPLMVANREFGVAGIRRGIYDPFLQPWENNFGKGVFEIMGLRVFGGENPVPDIITAVKEYGQSIGHELKKQTPKPRAQVNGTSTPQVSLP